MQAIIDEILVQRNVMAERAINYAAQLEKVVAEKDAEIKSLKEKIESIQGKEVFENEGGASE